MKKIFVSFRETDNDHREGFEGMLQNPNSPLRGIPISSRVDKRGEGDKAIEDHINEMIEQCDIVLVLIGDDSHDRKWIEYEMQVATSKQKKIKGVRIPETTGGGPKLYRERKLPLLEWDANEIAKEIKKY
jgi:hypothetical protein